jgi:hypothetical protein
MNLFFFFSSFYQKIIFETSTLNDINFINCENIELKILQDYPAITYAEMERQNYPERLEPLAVIK